VLSGREGSDDELVNFVLQTTRPKVCEDADMRDFIDHYGVTYIYDATRRGEGQQARLTVADRMRLPNHARPARRQVSDIDGRTA
jgi:hypothetical protein